MKKKLLILCLMMTAFYCSFSQSIGIGTATPDASAALDITAANKGLLIPRMNIASINAIINPAKGLLVYDSVVSQLMVNTGGPAVPIWQPVASSSNGWNLSGNNVIDPNNQFIGTTNNQPLRFRVNNIKAGELNPSTGNISMGLRAGQDNTTGFSNISFGTDALKLNKSGFGLVAIGDSALFQNDSGNPAPGVFAIFNTAIGVGSLSSNTIGTNNTAIGAKALLTNTSGNLNTATGFEALRSNTTGGFNTAIGGSSLSSNTTGTFNTAIGAQSLLLNTTG
ncbi:MAG: hypothetical protein ABI685_14910, partial [Ferruginibacter sp.]